MSINVKNGHWFCMACQSYNKLEDRNNKPVCAFCSAPRTVESVSGASPNDIRLSSYMKQLNESQINKVLSEVGCANVDKLRESLRIASERDKGRLIRFLEDNVI